MTMKRSRTEGGPAIKLWAEMSPLQPVQNAELCKVWRENTESPLATWDEPVYENFFRVLRAANWRLPAGRRIRLLLGDPAHRLDHDHHAGPGDLAAQSARRVRRVPDRTRGNQKGPPGIDLLRRQPRAAPGCGAAATRRPGIPRRAADRPAGVLHHRFDAAGRRSRRHVPAPRALSQGNRHPRPPAPGSGWSTPQTSFPALAPGPSGQPANINCGISLGSVIDGALYLGQASDLTMSHPDPAIYLDQAYWAELQLRNILQGGVPGLNALRQEQSARFTPQAVPPSLLCP